MSTGNTKETNNEQDLLKRFQQKDRAAFDRLFDQYADALLAFCVRLTTDRAEAEDLVSETFLAAYHNRERFRGDCRLLTYLMAIAVRRFRDGKRRPRVNTVALREETDGVVPAPTAEASAVTGVALQSALDALDEPLRVAFLLVAGQGLTYREAATVLRAPVGTIKWRVAEATKRLRAALQEENHESISQISTRHVVPSVPQR